MTARDPLFVVHDGAEPGELSMARDEELVRRLRNGEGPPRLLRGHGWSRPVVSLGRAQEPPADLVAAAREAGVPLVRRPTGGGWLLHLPGDLSVTWAVRGPLGPGDFRQTARFVARSIAGGLERTGVAAVVFMGLAAPASRAEVCFQRTDRDEVVVDGAKVAGVALARFGRSALVQTAIPLQPAAGPLARLAEQFDPERGAAAARLARIEPAPLWRSVAAAAAALLDREPRGWSWPSAWSAAAADRCAAASVIDVAGGEA
jgi:lipoate-protein ligase A